jgi:nucleoside-diphosphate-sugar epimerase
MKPTKIVVTGAAGLVGQNLVPRLKNRGFGEIVCMDKHAHNMDILRSFHPEVRALTVDLAQPGAWQDELAGATHVVCGHAQIGGLFAEEYVRNNVTATERLMEACVRHGVPYIVNISSSVVNSMAVDNYTETKKQQEAVVLSTGIRQVILRPTLMFGWFDRKHVGWLARFMQKVPVFPIPGDGRYLRQPLYVGDFCNVIVSSLEEQKTGAYNITGQERIDYIDLMRAVKEAVHAKARIVRVPYGLFRALLKAAALVDKNPAFTVKQLEALVTPDVFEVMDWPGTFGVPATSLQNALNETFRDPTYSQVALEF